MLNNTFIHIQGIGLKTEERFWHSGIRCWDDFTEPIPLVLSPAKKQFIREHVDKARQHLNGEPRYFTELLPASQHWRLFPHFRHSTAYLDIETTGLDGYENQITTIVLYDGTSVFTYVHGENLDDLIDDLAGYDVLVTYNGKCFDIPFIESFFNTRITQAHIDLRYVLRSLGYSGGLKKCEKQFGLDRGELDGVDGYFAVLLWYEYRKTGNRKALETLLAYNVQDTVNLEVLMVEAYNEHLRRTPFYGELQIPYPTVPRLPFIADLRIIDRIKSLYL